MQDGGSSGSSTASHRSRRPCTCTELGTRGGSLLKQQASPRCVHAAGTGRASRHTDVAICTHGYTHASSRVRVRRHRSASTRFLAGGSGCPCPASSRQQLSHLQASPFLSPCCLACQQAAPLYLASPAASPPAPKLVLFNQVNALLEVTRQLEMPYSQLRPVHVPRVTDTSVAQTGTPGTACLRCTHRALASASAWGWLCYIPMCAQAGLSDMLMSVFLLFAEFACL